MTTLREAAQQALKALCLPCSRWNGAQSKIVNDAAGALRAALAEPVQEPVAYWHKRGQDDEQFIHAEAVNGDCPDCVPLYAAPPQRKPLTEVDLRALYDGHAAYQEEGPEASGWWSFARAIERAHEIGGDE